MNQDSFKEFLTDESRLYSISYEELKSLTLAYPYSSLLRLLLLKKSYLDQHKDYERNVQTAAIYTTDRKRLYQTATVLKSMPLQKEYVTLGEDYLELAELSRLEKVLAVRHVSEAFNEKNSAASVRADGAGAIFDAYKTAGGARALREAPIFLFQEPEAGNFSDESSEAGEDSLNLSVDLNAPPPEKAADPAHSRASEPLALNLPHLQEEKARSIDIEITNLDRAKIQDAPEASKPLAPSFSAWLKQFRMDVDAIAGPTIQPIDRSREKAAVEKETVEKVAKPEPPDADDPYLPDESVEKEMDQRAVKSAYLSEDVISETLAALLALQGRNDMAVDMYKKLSLQFPDKSSFFAAKIEKLVEKPGQKFA